MLTKLDNPMSFERLGGRTCSTCVSSSPSKIPYVGFSPVRLQTGIQPRLSHHDRRLKRKTRLHRHDPGTYTWPKLRLYAPVARGQLWRGGCLNAPVQRPLARQWVLLSHRVIAYYGLIRNSRSLPPAYLLRPGGPWPYGLVWAGTERLPDLLCVSVPPCRHPYPGGSSGCIWLVLHRSHRPSPIRDGLGIRTFHPRRFRDGCVTRLQCSLHATARWFARPAPARTFTTELSPPRVAPQKRRR